MKVLMLNGSPHPKGSTYTMLGIVAEELAKYGVDSEIFHIGHKPVSGCIACSTCKTASDKQCVMHDVVNEFVEKAKEADGFVFASPVYFAGVTGQIKSFMDRLFICGREHMAYKPSFSAVCGRRAGMCDTYDQLNKYIGIANMLHVPSKYWNMMMGRTPEDILKDTEGADIMRNLAKNMAWMLNMLKLAKDNGIERP